MTTIDDTLAERGARYGDFTDRARIAQALQDVMRSAGDTTGWQALNATQKQALTVIADKIASILTGDPNHADNWHDIQGYAKLVEDRLPTELPVLSRIDRILGWHAWTGSVDGSPPCSPETWVQFEQRNGVRAGLCRAGRCRWTHERRDDDIVRYKVNDIVPEGAKADDGGWIEWKGGDCPLDGDTHVSVQFRSGSSGSVAPADVWRWANLGIASDIIAYRVVKD